MANAYRDENGVPTLIASSNADGFTPVRVYADPATHRLLTNTTGGGSTLTVTDGITTVTPVSEVDFISGATVTDGGGGIANVAITASGTGTVTSVSVVSANGFAGTVANATSVPAITVSTTITGILKGNGTAISAATAGTDYVTASSTNTFTNKTYDTAGTGNSFSINGLAATTNTGTGAVVRATSPTLTTPVIATIVNSGTLTLPTSTDTLVGRATTDTLTNKRITKRVITTTQSATPTINTDNTDVSNITGLAQAITSFTTNLSGTPNPYDSLVICITDNGTARAISWGASFESSTVTLPTTTVISTLLTVGFFWNSATSKWRCVAVA